MSSSVPSDTRAKTAKQLRRMRSRRIALRLLIGVGLPTLATAIYSGAIATPQYESVTDFTIQSADSAAAPSALQLLMSSVPGTASRDVMLVQQYVLSRDMLRHLLAEHEYREHFASENVDYMSRLDADAPFEEIYEYYLDHIGLEHESQSGMLTLRVRAFDAERANELGLAILAQSEEMVNALSRNAREDRIELAQAELTRAESRLGKARQSLRALQTESGELNPLASASAIMEIRGRLEGELAIARADLATTRATMPSNSPEVVAARRRVSALSGQITEQSARLAGDSEEGIDADLAQFEPVLIEKEFAQRAYESALTSMELARVDASRQHRYLVRIAGPSHPEDSSYPRVWYSILTVLLLSFALLSIGTLVVASIREHANV